jgi:hypothetical protein
MLHFLIINFIRPIKWIDIPPYAYLPTLAFIVSPKEMYISDLTQIPLYENFLYYDSSWT